MADQTTITNGATASSDNSLLEAGAVYVYKRSGVNWAQEAYIKAVNATAADHFGYNVDINGDTLAVSTINQSSADKTITHGTNASNDVSAANAGAGDQFGFSISLTNNLLAISSPYEDSSGFTVENGATSIDNDKATDSGAVYLYSRTGATWSPIAYLKAVNSYANLQFGTSVAIDGNTITTGSAYENSSGTTISNGQNADINSGAVYSRAVYIYGE